MEIAIPTLLCNILPNCVWLSAILPNGICNRPATNIAVDIIMPMCIISTESFIAMDGRNDINTAKIATDMNDIIRTTRI